MSGRSIDPAYLRYQYGTAEKLNIRIASHERYSERGTRFSRLGAPVARLGAGTDSAGRGLWLRRVPPGLGAA